MVTENKMTTLNGKIYKMPVELATPVTYYLRLGEQQLLLNSLLGQTIRLRYRGVIHCINCNRKTNKSFHQGFCFPCFRKLAECNLCSIHPEKCRYYEGVCREDDWAHAHCGQPHYVYLANSSGLKVGITRTTQIPTRWIDQGATQGLIMLEVKNRHQSGLVEVALKNYIADKTNWHAMLKSANDKQDLQTKRSELLTQAQNELTPIFERFPEEVRHNPGLDVMTIEYPVLTYPQKIVAINLDKTPEVTGVLQGIKGQYLLFDIGVLSMRKFAGYCIEWEVS